MKHSRIIESLRNPDTIGSFAPYKRHDIESSRLISSRIKIEGKRSSNRGIIDIETRCPFWSRDGVVRGDRGERARNYDLEDGCRPKEEGDDPNSGED